MLCFVQQASSHRTDLLLGVTAESINENWRALCHRAQLTAGTWRGSLVCEFVVLVAILKSIKGQGMTLKIKLKNL